MELFLAGMGLKFLITFIIGALIFWVLVIWTFRKIGTKLSIVWAGFWILGLPVFYFMKVPVMYHLAASTMMAVFMTIQLKYYGEF
jgi:hypothetical protein